MRLAAVPLFAGLLGVDIVCAGTTWLGSEIAGRDGLAPAIAVLLVASPLGFLLARYLPLPISRRLGRRDGVTHLGAAADRALPRLRHLVIEVEHVVTTGNLVVVDVVPLDVRHKHDLRWFAGALAHGSADPVARAISRLSGLGRPVDVCEGPAHELRGAVDRHPVRFDTTNVAYEAEQPVGLTVRVDVDLRPMGHITVADEVRKTAQRCLATLREQGIEPILVSSSLTKPELERVSEQVGVSRFHPGTDAATLVASLQSTTAGILRAVPVEPSGPVESAERTPSAAAAPSAPQAPASKPAASSKWAQSGKQASAEAILPRGAGEDGEDTVLRSADPSIDAVLGCIRHARSLRKSRRIAQACAATVVVLSVPLAATGILSLPQAAVVAGVGLLLVAAVAATAVLACSPEPADG